jgi:hypothetical protein
MIIGRSSTKFLFFFADQKLKLALKHFPHRVQCYTKFCRCRHFEFHTGTKNVKFVEDHLMTIHVQFGFNQPYGENVSKRFFSETTWIIETKLPKNDHWKVLYKFYVFYADRKSKMAATAELNLT